MTISKSSHETSGESYAPPDKLPSPPIIKTSFPLFWVVLGMVISLILGYILFAVTRLIYIYYLFNALVGLGFSWLIAIGIKRNNYTDEKSLYFITALCSFLVYMAFNLFLYFWIIGKPPGAVGGFLNNLWQRDSSVFKCPDPSPGFFSFIEFVWYRMGHEPFMLNIEIYDINIFKLNFKFGFIGNIIRLLIEFGITFYYAWRKVFVAIHSTNIESVPAPVRDFVAYLLSKGHDFDYISEELYKRGWKRPEDQLRALKSTGSLELFIIEAKREEDKSLTILDRIKYIGSQITPAITGLMILIILIVAFKPLSVAIFKGWPDVRQGKRNKISSPPLKNPHFKRNYKYIVVSGSYKRSKDAEKQKRILELTIPQIFQIFPTLVRAINAYRVFTRIWQAQNPANFTLQRGELKLI